LKVWRLRGEGAIARALCLSAQTQEDAGKVRLVLVPQVDTFGIATDGIDPEELILSDNLEKKFFPILMSGDC
jgi:hypothetical protein